MDPIVISTDGTVLPKQGLVVLAGSVAMTGLTIPAPNPGLQSAGAGSGVDRFASGQGSSGGGA